MLLTLLIPLLPHLVTLVEHIFGSKAGQDKLATVISMLTGLLEKAAKKLHLPMPAQATLVAEVEKIVATLFPSGTTTPGSGTGAPLPAATDAVIKQKLRDILAWSQGV
jgi:hypothetical protein